MKKYIVANWKMNMNKDKTNNWLADWTELNKQSLDNTVVIAPTSMYLYLFSEHPQLLLSGQDVSENEKGAYTGDIAAFQLKEYCQFCIVGHSERAEHKDIVIEKAQRCIESDIKPIICFADSTRVEEYLVEGAILTWEDPSNISVNGVFRPKPVEEIAQEAKRIRTRIPADMPLLYGGSVSENNIAEINTIPELNGVLVGAASLNAQSFYKIASAK